MDEDLGVVDHDGARPEASLEIATRSRHVPRSSNRRRIWIVAVAALVGVVLILVGIKAAQIRSMINAGKSFAPPPESVTSAKVQATEWEASRAAVGTLVALRAVTVASEVPGLVRRIGFDSGAFVRRGEVLVELDASTEEAQLAAARADAELARATLERSRTLVASLQSIHPIHADFWLPQQALIDLAPGMRVRLRTDVFPQQGWDGAVTTINPEVDVSTRNVRVRATFPNPDGRLRPGMFANVDVISPEKRPVVVIPATAVIYAPYGDSVFALEEKKDAGGDPTLVARQKFVRLGERRGDLVAVVSGLAAGETVVSSGAFKLRNGTAVVVRNDLAPSAELAPKPVDK